MRKRIFLAINLPEQVKKEITALQVKLKKFDWPVRWEPSEKWHLTLRFLGMVETDELEKVKAITTKQTASVAPFILYLNGLIVLPSLPMPRVLGLKFRHSSELEKLHEALADEISEKNDLGEWPRHPFTPHVTLGRLNGTAENFRALAQMDFKINFMVNSIEIMRSHLKSEGSEYKMVASCKLGGNNFLNLSV